MKINTLSLSALLAISLILSSCSGSKFMSKAPATLSNEDKVVYFEFNSAELDSEYKSQIKKKVARWIEENPVSKVVIEGHCDERGTREYNKKLGYKRANAVKDLLVKYGVEASKIKVISYGEDKPAVKGSNEEAWEQNRRAVTVTFTK